MPSAAAETNNKILIPPVGKVDKVVEMMDPFNKAITAVEHKIRNLEKRKGKLDAYKLEQEQGKELNADQLLAVSKYSEVVMQLDLSRDLVKQLVQINGETIRACKKQQKKEQMERAVMDMDKCKLVVVLRTIQQQLAQPHTRQQFCSEVKGALNWSSEDLVALEEFCNLITPQCERANFQAQVDAAAEHLSFLFDGKPKLVVGKTYVELKALITVLSASEYFKGRTDVRPKVGTGDPSPFIHLPKPQVPPITTAQMVSMAPDTFIKDSSILDAPHMDPAIVAVKSFVPPLTRPGEVANVFSQAVDERINAVKMTTSNPPQKFTPDITKAKEEDDVIDDWNASTANGKTNNNNETNGDPPFTTYGERGHGNRDGQGGHGRTRGPRQRGRGRGVGGYQNGGRSGGDKSKDIQNGLDSNGRSDRVRDDGTTERGYPRPQRGFRTNNSTYRPPRGNGPQRGRGQGRPLDREGGNKSSYNNNTFVSTN